MGNGVEITLIDSIDKESIKELGTDYSELLLDDFISNETLKEIPIIGSIAKIYKLGLSYRDYLFNKKILRFLFKLSEIPLKQREQFISKINRDQAFKAKLGEQLLILLERFDDVNKADLLVKAFGAYVKEKVDYKAFCLLSIAIERFSLIFKEDFIVLYSIHRNPPDKLLVEHLFNCGLVSTKDSRETGADMPKGNLGSNYKKNELGFLFYEQILNGKSFNIPLFLEAAVKTLKIQPSTHHNHYLNVVRTYEEIVQIIRSSDWGYPAQVGVSDVQISIPEGMIRKQAEDSYYMMVLNSE